jgi:hypothetical protein
MTYYKVNFTFYQLLITSMALIYCTLLEAHNFCKPHTIFFTYLFTLCAVQFCVGVKLGLSL